MPDVRRTGMMSGTTPHDTETPSTGGASSAAWVVLAVLTAFNVLNFVDRQLIAGLAPLLIADLGLTRADIGLLDRVSASSCSTPSSGCSSGWPPTGGRGAG